MLRTEKEKEEKKKIVRIQLFQLLLAIGVRAWMLQMSVSNAWHQSKWNETSYICRTFRHTHTHTHAWKFIYVERTTNKIFGTQFKTKNGEKHLHNYAYLIEEFLVSFLFALFLRYVLWPSWVKIPSKIASHTWEF